MTKYLTLALYAGGPSDHEFLQPVIQRVVFQCANSKTQESVEVADQFIRPEAVDANGRVDKIDGMFAPALSALSLLFIHADGAGDAASAFRNNIDPAMQRLLARRPGGDTAFVGIVPVRETEAWAISDAEAVRNVLGVSWSPVEIGFPATPLEAEKIQDPKSMLRMAQQKAVGVRKKRLPPIMGLLGEKVSLDRLRQMPSFCRFEGDLERALEQLLRH